MLPTFIEKLSLYLGNEVEPDDVEKVVDQVIECKMNRCPRLDTYFVKTMDLIEMDEEEESQLKDKSVEAGIEIIHAAEPSHIPTS